MEWERERRAYGADAAEGGDGVSVDGGRIKKDKVMTEH